MIKGSCDKAIKCQGILPGLYANVPSPRCPSVTYFCLFDLTLQAHHMSVCPPWFRPLLVPQLDSGPDSNWALGCPPIPTFPITLRFGLYNELHFPPIFSPSCLSLIFDLVPHLSGIVQGFTLWFSPYEVPRKLLHQRVDIWGWTLGLEPSPRVSRPFLSTLHPFL